MNLLIVGVNLPAYCEQQLGWVAGQPINIISNALFLIFAVIAYRQFSRYKVASGYLKFLALLLGVVGVGSATFHYFYNFHTILFDSIPIYIFMIAALGYWVRLLTKSKAIAFSASTAFVGIQLLLSVLVPSSFANGSIRHIVAFLFLLILGLFTLRKYPDIVRPFGLAISMYVLAIVARSIDIAACEGLYIGTHFLWHIFAALAGYLVIVILMRLYSRVFN